MDGDDQDFEDLCLKLWRPRLVDAKKNGRYDFATRCLVGFAPLPAFRHLSPEEYQNRVAGLIREIEDEGEWPTSVVEERFRRSLGPGRVKAEWVERSEDP